LVPIDELGAELIRADRGGAVTYHGPGQLVGYPVVTLGRNGHGERDVARFVRTLEQVLIDVLANLGVSGERRDGLPGVWVGPAKIASIGIRVQRGRTRHGFALNVAPELEMFERISPCGMRDSATTSLAQLLDPAPTMEQMVDLVVGAFAAAFGYTDVERRDEANESVQRHALKVGATPGD
jgi:lipoate-protein ligase B